MRQTRNAYKTFAIKPIGKSHLGDLGIDRMMILKCILMKYGKGWVLELSDSVYDVVVGSSEHSNKPLGSIKD
jgi:hypothetical protein